ncbi:MAG TPA: glycosyltransferase family 4 protein [Herpetosiphonaceae bacterium]
MRDVLMIAYYFPPLGGSGVQRSLKFARYLPEHGWRPLVVAPRRGLRDEPMDPSLLAELPAAAEVTRTGRLDLTLLPRIARRLRLGPLSRLLTYLTRYLPDAQVGWLPWALPAALRQARRADVIYSTSAPYSDHLLAWLCKRATGKPWVADFRDEWSANPSLRYPSPAFLALNRALERRLLRAADAVIVTSRLHAVSQRRLLPPEQRAKVRLIHNGFDPADRAALVPRARDGRWTLAHVGSLYGVYQPDTLLAALDLAVRDGSIPASDVRLVFAGALSRSAPVPAALAGVVEFTGYLPHGEALGVLDSADAALIILGTHGAARDGRAGVTAVPGKMFEYWMLGKPILALAPAESYAAELLRGAGYAAIRDPGDVAGVAGLLAAEYRRWRDGAAHPPLDGAYVARFERRALAGELAAVFDEVLA